MTGPTDMTDMTGPSPDEASMTFEQLVDSLERITQRMADGDVGIEEAVDLYERAGHLHALATDRLARIQDRIAHLAPPDPTERD